MKSHYLYICDIRHIRDLEASMLYREKDISRQNKLYIRGNLHYFYPGNTTFKIIGYLQIERETHVDHRFSNFRDHNCKLAICLWQVNSILFSCYCLANVCHILRSESLEVLIDLQVSYLLPFQWMDLNALKFPLFQNHSLRYLDNH